MSEHCQRRGSPVLGRSPQCMRLGCGRGPRCGAARRGMSTEYPGCAEVEASEVLSPGAVLSGTVNLETEYGPGTYVAIAGFTDHHNGEASSTFSLE